MKAEHWHRDDDGRVHCDLCPHRCTIAEGKTGRCHVRRVEGGVLMAASYGRVSSLNMDPIEKKPLYHFHPGSMIFSVGGWGCNLRCRFCQNWTISQQLVESGPAVMPEQLVRKAVDSGSTGIAYTYNEPLIAFEFVRDCALVAREAGLHNVLVTNGLINPAPAAELLPLVDAANMDLKSMDDSFYREECGGRVAPVRQFAEQVHAAGVHLEITNLVIPGLNDTDETLAALAAWIADHLGEEIPLHLSAYHPQYEMTRPATDVDTLVHAGALCRERLSYVYLGNVMTRDGCDTACPGCDSVLIRRSGYRTQVAGLDPDGLCRACSRPFDGVFG
jgi:pyruvate formate lyase activating enzyme